MQGGQSCCSHQAAAALLFSCSSVWSAPLPARWSNSVLNAALCQRSAQGSTSCPALGVWPITPTLLSAFVFFLISAGCLQLLWEVGLLAHPYSQPLLLYPCWATESSVLRVRLLVPSHSLGQVEHPTLPLLSMLDYSLLFCWGGVGLPRCCAGLFSGGGWGGESHVVCDAHLFLPQFHADSFGAD
jgi:hypothetical protein